MSQNKESIQLKIRNTIKSLVVFMTRIGIAVPLYRAAGDFSRLKPPTSFSYDCATALKKLLMNQLIFLNFKIWYPEIKTSIELILDTKTVFQI